MRIGFYPAPRLEGYGLLIARDRKSSREEIRKSEFQKVYWIEVTQFDCILESVIINYNIHEVYDCFSLSNVSQWKIYK